MVMAEQLIFLIVISLTDNLKMEHSMDTRDGLINLVDVINMNNKMVSV